ncbi:carboxymuconolactone decarboxylase family protein [Desulfobacterota bacterium AH_259_B03_O07]|nr:carboxymuconolactone decarboxylase family protein [Desulfobacterota bacterium AH_259_B03_O07]
MARVKYIEEDQVNDPKVKEAYERMIKKRGKVTNIYKAFAHKPSILATIGPFVAAVQQPDELDAKLKERIILRVSNINRSRYCCHAHRQISAKMGLTEEEISEMDNPDLANIPESEKAALKYAEALTVNPGNISDKVFDDLKKYYIESQIVEITAIAALYNMINRFNEALKLDPEEY